jgi:MFS family permease
VFGLTCESAFLRNIYGSTYMIGLLFGSFILGIVSDRFGRMKALTVSFNFLFYKRFF